MEVYIVGAAGAMTAPIVAALAQAQKQGIVSRINLQIRGLATSARLADHGLCVDYGAHRPEHANKFTVTLEEFHLYQPGTQVMRPQDFIVLGVKATDLNVHLFTGLEAAGVIGNQTKFVTIQNGVPFWMPLTAVGLAASQQHPELAHIEAVDPAGWLIKTYGQRMIGGFTMAAARSSHDAQRNPISGTSRIIGDLPYSFRNPAGEVWPEVAAFADALRSGGLKVAVPDNLAVGVWNKITGNAACNMISVAHGVTLQEISENTILADTARKLMAEVQAVALAYGVAEDKSGLVPIDGLLSVIQRLPHKPSTALDYENRKPLELDALVRAVIDIGDCYGVLMPELKRMYGSVLELASAQGIRMPPQRPLTAESTSWRFDALTQPISSPPNLS